MKKAGARGFDAYAHHPYYGAPVRVAGDRARPGAAASRSATSTTSSAS